MKRKFQFLRRQNTDTVVDHDNSLSIFTMTTYDQALLWSRSLDDLLRDKSKENFIRNFSLWWHNTYLRKRVESYVKCQKSPGRLRIHEVPHQNRNYEIISKMSYSNMCN